MAGQHEDAGAALRRSLHAHAQRALGSESEADAFMGTSHPRLLGRSPSEAAGTEADIIEIERILNALEHGLAL